MFLAAVVLRSADVQVIARSQIDTPPGLNPTANDVQVVAGIELDVASGVELARRRGALCAIGAGGAMASANTQFEAATGAAVHAPPTLRLLAFLANATLGNVNVDVSTLDGSLAGAQTQVVPSS